MEKVVAFHLNKLNSLHPRILCAIKVWLKNWPICSGEEVFWISSMYFRYFVIISPRRSAWPFVWRNLNSFYQRMLCAKFSWNWPSGSGEDEIVESLQTDGRRTKGDQNNKYNTLSPFYSNKDICRLYKYFVVICQTTATGRRKDDCVLT